MASKGYREASDSEPPAVWIVNTCAVTAEGARKSRKAVRRCVSSGARVIVTGCAASLEDWTARGAAGVFSNDEKPGIASWACPDDGGAPVSFTASGLVRAPLKVQDGCRRYCSYCMVPYLRGRPYSRTVRDVLADAVALREAGAREAVICGIDLGSYEGPEGEKLVDLVEALLGMAPSMHLRLSSLAHSDIDDRLLALMAADNNLCRHLHLPMQSGDARVLADMRRGYTPRDFEQKVEEIRASVPGVAVTTDVMVGFPTESEEAFDVTAAMLESLGFARVHVFRYSPRPGTKAFALGDPVSALEKDRRSEVLRGIAAMNAGRFHARFVGRIMPVLVEATMKTEPGCVFARTESFVGVIIEGSRDLVGRSIVARIKASNSDGLRAVPALGRQGTL